MTPRAILIPAFNAAATIADTLESIQRQTPPGLAHINHIIVADDGSTDATVAVARASWHSTSPALEVWPSPRNQGERATCNSAFRRLHESGVEWCFVLHADDVAKPHWLETLQAITETAPEHLASVCSSWDNWLEDGRIVAGENDEQRATEFIAGTPEAARSTLERGCWWHFSGCAVQLPNFFRVGPFDETMPQLGDIEWVVRCCLAGYGIAYVPRTLITYRALATSVSSVSFRTNRELREAAYIHTRHGGDNRLAEAMTHYLSSRARVAAFKVLAHVRRGHVKGALSAASWAWYFASQSRKSKRTSTHLEAGP